MTHRSIHYLFITPIALSVCIANFAYAGAAVCTFGQVIESVQTPFGGVRVPVPVSTCTGSVTVATPDDVTSATASLRTQLQSETDTKLATLDSNIKTTLKAAVDQLPQRLLTDAAKQELMEALRVEFHAQLDQLRADLQVKIDAITTASATTHPSTP